MATHSSILAWKIPWTEEPGGLQSMGSQRVRHDRIGVNIANCCASRSADYTKNFGQIIQWMQTS